MLSLVVLSLLFPFHAYVYHLETDVLDAVLDTTPSAVLYYLEGDQLSELIRANFIEASERLTHYGILFGTFNCALDPEQCKNAQVRNLPDLRLNMFAF